MMEFELLTGYIHSYIKLRVPLILGAYAPRLSDVRLLPGVPIHPEKPGPSRPDAPAH